MKNTNRKVNEAAFHEIANILLFDVSDPRLQFVTVTGVEVSRDRSVMNVFVSAEKSEYDEVVAGLKSAKGRIRTLLGNNLGWRVSPEIRFRIDESVDEVERISEALSKEALRWQADEE